MTILEALNAAITAAGSRSQFCRAHNLSPAYLSEVLRGTRRPGPKILAAVGWTVATEYRPKEEVEK